MKPTAFAPEICDVAGDGSRAFVLPHDLIGQMI